VQAALLRGLADPDPWVRYYACQSLGRLGCETAAARLSELVFDGAGQVRVAAVEALSHLSSPAAHQALRSVAHSDEEDIRRAALIGLGIAGRAEDLPVLLAATSCGDLATRLVALSALSAFDAPCVLAALAAAAFDAAEPVSAAAINVLGGRAEHEATEILVSLLTRPATRERALEALTVPAAGRIPGVLASLATASDELAPLLTSALARMRSAEALEALFETMQLANPAARRAAAYTLAAQGSTRAVHILRETATSDSDDSVRQISALLISP
jgi:HEAT repeat protein